MIYYLDTSVILLAAGTESPQREACQAVLKAIADRRVTAVVSTETLVEALHLATWLQARGRGLDLLDHLLTLFPNPIALSPAILREAQLLLRRHPRLGLRGGLQVACARSVEIRDLISTDEDLGLVAGMRRWEPQDVPLGQPPAARPRT